MKRTPKVPQTPPKPQSKPNRVMEVRASERVTITVDGPLLKTLDELHPIYGRTVEDRIVTLLRRELIRLLEEDVPIFKLDPEPET